MHEHCALAAAINVPTASQFVYDCLVLQEHRGEKSTGIISVDKGVFFHERVMGRPRNNFIKYDFAKGLAGKTAIGQSRYATCGAADSVHNIQPFFFHESKYGPFALAHNGALANIQEIKQSLIKEGVVFQSTTDSELFGHLIARSQKGTIEEAIIEATQKVKAAYALLIFTPDKLIAVRDRFGVRPLSIGQLNGGFLVCSESYTFDQYPACSFVRDVQPGEMVVFQRDVPSFKSIRYANDSEHYCVFEAIYFSHPRSKYNEYYNEDFRFALGEQVFAENPTLQGDVIVPVLDSGKHAAWGLAKVSGIPYKEYFLRIHNPPNTNLRSFTSVNPEERKKTAFKKLHLRKEAVRGKRIITVDDSIVRSTTITLINQRLREAGALHITNCVTSPMITNICPYGMDFQNTTELVAYNKSVEEIKQRIGADAVIYLSLEGLKKTIKNTFNKGVCTGCFGDKYPLALEERKA